MQLRSPLLRPLAALLAAMLLGACSARGDLASPTPPPASVAGSTGSDIAADESPAGWFASGQRAALARGAGAEDARNLILFIGDGMGPTTVAAARILDGQRRGQPGEENLLSFERFPHTAYSKTYNTDTQTPDSAGTMTAMMTGVKTRSGVIGVDGRAVLGDCASAAGTELPSLLQLAERAGLATGIVTTTRITHATPAATYAHTPHRDWESDAQLPPQAHGRCVDIASQWLAFADGDGIEVVMGGGRGMLLPAGQADPEYPELGGKRQDGRDLIAEWQSRHPQGRFLWNRQDFDALDFASAGKVLALFEPGHMRYEHERHADRAGEPSLAEMVRAALLRLSRQPEGYLLVVEGGRIDHAHHAGNAFRALTDTIAFAEAVQVARELTRVEDTLIVVTADHSHVLSFAGYSARGNPILGLANQREDSGRWGPARDLTGRRYPTLSYANGPGYAGASDQQPAGAKRHYHLPSSFAAADARPDLEHVDTRDPDFLQPALWALDEETHGGEDVGVYASGPGAGGVRGVMEQHVIFHLLQQAHPLLRVQPAGPAATSR